MALFDYQDRKPLLYADLFKPQKKTDLKQGNKNNNTTTTFYSDGSSSGSSSNLFNCDSSSSGFSTPFESELGSSESDDADFMSELTRQMAECMLDEDSEGTISPVKSHNEIGCYMDSAAINNLKYSGLYPGPVPSKDETQVYQLKNQARVSKQPAASRVGQFNGTELAHTILHNTDQPYMQYRVKQWGIGKGGTGNNRSGVQAVFLGGPGSKNGSGGTGVFLPRITNDPSELNKKQGCSTVLIPTRVLQTLEQLSNGRSRSAATPLNVRRASPNQCYSKVESTKSVEGEFKNQPTSHEDLEIKLPQEWTY